MNGNSAKGKRERTQAWRRELDIFAPSTTIAPTIWLAAFRFVSPKLKQTSHCSADQRPASTCSASQSLEQAKRYSRFQWWGL
jgi:hypothetical protein